MSGAKLIMWIKQPVFSFTILHMLEVASTATNTSRRSNKNGSQTEASSGRNTTCDIIDPLGIGIIFFLAATVIFLLILLFRELRARHDTRVTNERTESTPLSQNCALNVRPPSVNGAYDSSSTSSESPEGSMADISCSSQRYTTLHYRCKDTDYINISEGTLNLNNKKSCNIDYENVTEAQKKITEKDHKNCDDGNASDSSDTSVESTVHYSKVVFPKADK